MAGFTESLQQLPVLGVGASLSFGVQPDPVQLASLRGGPSFVEYAGAVDVAPVEASVRALHERGVPVLYHPSCLNLCGPFPNPPAWLAAVADHVAAVRSVWLAQDVAVCFVGATGGYSIQLGYFVPPVLTRDGLDEAVLRVSEVRSRVPAPLLLEPAPVTFALGDMDVFRWLGELARRTDCGLSIDCGQVVSHQLASGRELLEGLDALDYERIVALRVAGGVIEARGTPAKRYYRDAHDLPVLPETWRVLRHVVERAPNLRAVCVECEGAMSSAILPLLRRTRERVSLGTVNEALKIKVRAELDASDGVGP